MEPTQSSKIPIAIVGLNFGRKIIQKELIEGKGAGYFEVAGLCDLDPGRLQEASARFGLTTFADLETLLAAPSIPAIGLYTGPFGRAELLRKIIRAGKHVMTTKPFELDPDSALSVLQEARERKCVIHLNSPAPQPAPDIEQILQWHASYNLGRPVGCRADVWVSYAEKPDGTWLDDPERCPVAPLFRLGIYLINDLIHLFGSVDEVHVFSSRLLTQRPTPDTAQLALKFRNGALANIFATFCVEDGDVYKNSLVLNFQNGTVYRNCGPQSAISLTYKGSELSLVKVQNGQRVIAAEAKAESSVNYRWDLFSRAIRGETIEGEITPEQTVEGVRVIRAMAEAHRTGRSVRV